MAQAQQKGKHWTKMIDIFRAVKMTVSIIYVIFPPIHA